MNTTRNMYIGLCGFICSECPAYVGTKNNDVALIERTAKEWSTLYAADIRPEHVWCAGCTTEGGRKSAYCESGCEVRKCAASKGFFSCALCNERALCAKIAHIAQVAPGSVVLLDALAKFSEQFGKES